MNSKFNIIKRLPTIKEYKNICISVGWKDFMNFYVAEESISRSIFSVVVEYDDEVVGMGRVVGDGFIYFYIQDIAVKPEYQGQGVGSMIMKTIINYLKENAPENAFIGLFASQGKEAFYNNYGFNKHEGMTGMFGVKKGQEIV